jgi:head-tail adaptor
MKKVPGKEGVDGRQQVRRFTSRIDSSSRLQVQTRPLDVAGLGKALQAEDELIVEFQVF